jgi:hypothetical protein
VPAAPAHAFGNDLLLLDGRWPLAGARCVDTAVYGDRPGAGGAAGGGEPVAAAARLPGGESRADAAGRGAQPRLEVLDGLRSRVARRRHGASAAGPAAAAATAATAVGNGREGFSDP